MSSLKRKTLHGLFWSFIQRFSGELINFITKIILARLLLPSDFGIIAMILVFIAIGEFLVDGGMTTSLIRLKEPSHKDYSTVFFSNITVSTLVYAIIFFIAPFVAKFYEKELLTTVLRVLALSVVIKSFVVVHMAKLTKELDFKTQMKVRFPSNVISGAIGIYLALEGFGVWSLVWMNLTQAMVVVLLGWILIKWRPSLLFNRKLFHFHFNFGYKMTLSGLIDTVYNNLYNIAIGKYFSPATVGYYSQADNLRLFPVKQLSSVISNVTFPVFSSITNDKALKNAYKRTMKLVLFTTIPMMSCLILIAEPLIILVFGEKWIPSVLYFQILSLASIFRPISSFNLNILKVKSRSDLFLKLEVIKKVIGLIVFIIAFQFGILVLIWSFSITAIMLTFINGFYSGKLIDYKLQEQLADFFKPLLLGVFSFLAIYWINLFPFFQDLNKTYTIITISFIYFSVYLGISYIFNRSVIFDLIGLITKKEL
ncbi:lipopolysaccharide biosynthesis protein [Flagellimonas sp. 2504JD1-5]